MALEGLLNFANGQYVAKGMAVIHKRPIPVKILRTHGTRIISAVLESKSTVDYSGIYNGYPLEFEAKSTQSRSSFALKNIHEHQVEHLRSCEAQGAICFMILEFSTRNEIFYVPAQLVIRVWDTAQLGGPKSIPYDDIAVACYKVTSGRGVVLDYLQVVDELISRTA